MKQHFTKKTMSNKSHLEQAIEQIIRNWRIHQQREDLRICFHSDGTFTTNSAICKNSCSTNNHQIETELTLLAKEYKDELVNQEHTLTTVCFDYEVLTSHKKIEMDETS